MLCNRIHFRILVWIPSNLFYWLQNLRFLFYTIIVNSTYMFLYYTPCTFSFCMYQLLQYLKLCILIYFVHILFVYTHFFVFVYLSFSSSSQILSFFYSSSIPVQQETSRLQVKVLFTLCHLLPLRSRSRDHFYFDIR